LLAGAATPRAAAAQVYSEELRIKGAWPDIAVSFGGGIGVGNGLDTNVFGRLRLGGLYAYEPWVANLGVTGELGALPQRGAGLELEINHFGGPWVQGGLSRVVGVSRTSGAQWMTHAALGFALFGVEWQHRLGTPSDNAVLFLLRAPIGIWWFLVHDHEARKRHKADQSQPHEG
jgi:hypothetical protein